MVITMYAPKRMIDSVNKGEPTAQSPSDFEPIQDPRKVYVSRLPLIASGLDYGRSPGVAKGTYIADVPVNLPRVSMSITTSLLANRLNLDEILDKPLKTQKSFF